MARRLLAPLAAAVFVLGVAACGPDEPEPRKTTLIDLDSDEASDGGGEEPSDGGGDQPEIGDEPSAAPDIPAPDPADFPGMTEENQDGAVAAFMYYMDISMWSHQTGDDALIQTLEAESCSICQEFNSEIYDIQESGEPWSEFDVQPIGFSVGESEVHDFSVNYKFTTGEHTRWSYEDSERWEAPKIAYDATGEMVWESGVWKVGELGISWDVDDA